MFNYHIKHTENSQCIGRNQEPGVRLLLFPLFSADSSTNHSASWGSVPPSVKWTHIDWYHGDVLLFLQLVVLGDRDLCVDIPDDSLLLIFFWGCLCNCCSRFAVHNDYIHHGQLVMDKTHPVSLPPLSFSSSLHFLVPFPFVRDLCPYFLLSIFWCIQTGLVSGIYFYFTCQWIWRRKAGGIQYYTVPFY